MAMPGGVGGAQPADETSRAVAEAVKATVQAQAGGDAYELHSYSSQVVAGVNYFLKIKVSNSGTFAHVRVFQPLGGKDPEFHSLQKDKAEADPISYF
eukprot:CAMPEP_0175811112 /NCGR_PEP_ID=MMETSP0107_2-20121207/3678_1 /TAXON_ID=195067 ORGANISM="Goniomonas pacifica, Strain CCMP1869" /NCGR_SAMPLE_ID=MMETSP0107_2 /ASSEMBLY_ACC=CAM_ASM_000203 /LENGTH=96 /DNA_ID=CAMNT_0017122903 /DNA_START=14 /DNA_END=304 /DNA_ORIENTATION=-